MMPRLFCAAVAAALSVGAMPAQAAAPPTFDDVIVFGDSLSDVGNVFAVTKAVGIPTPGAPYF